MYKQLLEFTTINSLFKNEFLALNSKHRLLPTGWRRKRSRCLRFVFAYAIPMCYQNSLPTSMTTNKLAFIVLIAVKNADNQIRLQLFFLFSLNYKQFYDRPRRCRWPKTLIDSFSVKTKYAKNSLIVKLNIV